MLSRKHQQHKNAVCVCIAMWKSINYVNQHTHTNTRSHARTTGRENVANSVWNG